MRKSIFGRKPVPTGVDLFKEIESELEFTREALDLTKSSLRIEAQKVDELESKLRRFEGMEHGSPSELGSTVSSVLQPAQVESPDDVLREYQEKLLSLSTRMHEQEREFRQKLALKDARIGELEGEIFKTPIVSGNGSPEVGAVCAPVETKPKIKVLEQRIFEMTVMLDEKDKAVFEAENVVDNLKIEMNQLRVEAARVTELMIANNELENTVASLRDFEARKVEEVDRLLSTILYLEHSNETVRHEMEELTVEHDRTCDRLALSEQLLVNHQDKSKLHRECFGFALEPPVEECPIPKETVDFLMQTGYSLIIVSSPKAKDCQTEDWSRSPSHGRRSPETVKHVFSAIPIDSPKPLVQLKSGPMTEAQVQALIDEQAVKIRQLERQVQLTVPEVQTLLTSAKTKIKYPKRGCLPSLFSRK